MTTTINHDTRASLGLSLVEYSILDFCAQRAPLMLGTGIAIISESLGLSKSSVTDAMKELIAMTPSLLDKKENGYYYPSTRWYTAHWQTVEASQTKSQQFAADVILLFNEINKSKYSAHTYESSIATIIKSNPSVTMDHFKSVIIHKSLTWGVDEKMSQYNRPATIFSRKFMVYLDEANRYWIQKANNDYKPA